MLPRPPGNFGRAEPQPPLSEKMYGMPEELSDLPTLMNNLLGSAATFRGHPDGAGTARLLEVAAQALQQQVAETKARRRHRPRSPAPPTPKPTPCARAALAPTPLPHHARALPPSFAAAAGRVLSGAAWAGDRVSDPRLRAEHQVRAAAGAPRDGRAGRRQRRRSAAADADGDALCPDGWGRRLRRVRRRRRRAVQLPAAAGWGGGRGVTRALAADSLATDAFAPEPATAAAAGADPSPRPQP